MSYTPQTHRIIAGGVVAGMAVLGSFIGVMVNVAQEHSENMRQENLQACAELNSEDAVQCVLLEIGD